MKETLLTYETPQIDIVEVVVEQGFAVSEGTNMEPETLPW